MNELQVTRMSGFGQGKSATFDRSPISLGTAPGSDLKFDPSWDKTVSGRHAFIEWKDGRWMVSDAGSREGTLVNGKRLTAPVPVGAGVEIELGAGGPRVKAADPAWDRATPGAGQGRASGPGCKGGGASRPAGEGTSKAVPVLAALVVLGVIGGLSWFFWQKHLESTDAARQAIASASEAAAKAESATKAADAAAAKAKEASERELPKDIDDQFIEVAKAHENCVGVVVLSGQTRDGKGIAIPNATAWAIGPNVMATNSHVTDGIKQYAEQGVAAFVVINKNPDLRFRVLEAVVHPRYPEGGDLVNVDGKTPAIPPFDVGILRVEGELPNFFRVAPKEALEKLDSGTRVAYLGFPMEKIAGGGVDYRSPVATMQSGIITAATDYWLSKAQFPNRLLIAHNLGATGGSSGSPIFNARGEVVALLSAGNIVSVWKPVQGVIIGPGVVAGGLTKDEQGNPVQVPLALKAERAPSGV
ncbi:MAG: trypsin-like peptidase domain-containing protein, partial [Verrucomicrobiae bacterium]|nr:trypsin-like peptidase domain-containing protein [Verrucomicrobiae bacterium]